MVALCFSMCREIGENHEGAARTQLKIIESQPWGECNLNVQNNCKGQFKMQYTVIS